MKPIALAYQDSGYLPQKCFVSGWGQTDWVNKHLSTNLMEINVTLFNKENCAKVKSYCSMEETGPGQVCIFRTWNQLTNFTYNNFTSHFKRSLYYVYFKGRLWGSTGLWRWEGFWSGVFLSQAIQSRACNVSIYQDPWLHRLDQVNHGKGSVNKLMIWNTFTFTLKNIKHVEHQHKYLSYCQIILDS